MNCPHCNEYAPDTNYRCPHCRKVLQPEKDLTDVHKIPSKRSSSNINILIAAVIVIGLAVFIYAVFFKGDNEGINSDRAPGFQKKRSTDARSGKFSEMFKSIGEEQAGKDQGISTDTDMDTDAIGDNESDSGDESAGGEPEVGYVINLANPGEKVYIEDYVQGGKTTIFDFYSEFCGPCRKISPRLKLLDEMNDDIVVVKIDINRKNVQGIDWNSPVARQYNLRSIPYFVIFDSSGRQSHEGSSAWRQVYEYLKEKGI